MIAGEVYDRSRLTPPCWSDPFRNFAAAVKIVLQTIGEYCSMFQSVATAVVAIVAAISLEIPVQASLQSDLVEDPEDQDVLCSRWADNCTACTEVEETPVDGRLKRLRCQWVVWAPASVSACIGVPIANAAGELTDWIRRHVGVASSKNGQLLQYEHASPTCKLLLRSPDQCKSDPKEQETRARRCGVATPSCESCAMRGCSFCGQRNIVAAGGADAAMRCASKNDVGTSRDFCSVGCEGKERTFQLSAQQSISGLIEYPLWRRYGLTYAPGQQCTWLLGWTESGGTVSGAIAHDLEHFDALHVLEAGKPLEMKPIGKTSLKPVVLVGLAAPVTLRFFSDGAAEATGFTAQWDYVPPPGVTAQGGEVSSNDENGRADTVDDGFGGHRQIFLLAVPISGGALVVIILACVLADCVRRRSRRFVSQKSGQPGYLPSERVPPPAKWTQDFENSFFTDVKEAHANSAAGKNLPPAGASDSNRKSASDSDSGRQAGAPEGKPKSTMSAAAAAATAGLDPQHYRTDCARNSSEQETKSAPTGSDMPRNQFFGSSRNRRWDSGRASSRTTRPEPTAPPKPDDSSEGQWTSWYANCTGDHESANETSHSATGVGHADGRTSAKSSQPEKQPARNVQEHGPDPLPSVVGAATRPASAVRVGDLSVEETIALIRGELLKHMEEPLPDRRAFIRELQRRWHPDKNEDQDKAVATAVFQFISSSSRWFLG